MVTIGVRLENSKFGTVEIANGFITIKGENLCTRRKIASIVEEYMKEKTKINLKRRIGGFSYNSKHDTRVKSMLSILLKKYS